MDHAYNALGLIAAVAAAVAAVVYLVKLTRAAFRYLERIEAVVGRELTNNSGSSMKDKVDRNATEVERLAQHSAALAGSVAEIRATLVELTGGLDQHNQQSRTAIAIYREGLRDQGIHLPYAPGEQELEVDDTPTSSNGRHRRSG